MLPAVKQYIAGNGVRVYRIACEVLHELTGRVYLLLGGGPPTLVDTGSGQGQSTRQILAGIEAVRSDFGEPILPADIRRILITHAHLDHIGGLWQLLERISAEVGIHPLDCRALKAPHEWTLLGRRQMQAFLQQAGVEPRRQQRLLASGGFTVEQLPGLPLGISLQDGRELDGLKFIHTPGHAPGHVCIVIGDILLCADHLLARTVPQQWPESFFPYTGLGHYFESLDKVQRMPGLRLAMGGHEPVICRVYERIELIRSAQLRRLDRLAEIVEKATYPLSVANVTKQMYAHKHGFHELLALSDVGARMEFLHQRGRLVVANLDELERQETPVYRYSTV